MVNKGSVQEVDPRDTILAMQQASIKHQQGTGFAQYTLPKAKLGGRKKPVPKPKVVEKKPPHHKVGVDLTKQLLGCVCGVIRDMGGEITVVLEPCAKSEEAKANSWAEAKADVRYAAMAESIADQVIDQIDNREERLCSVAKLRGEVVAAIKTALVEGNTSQLRSNAMSTVEGGYRLWAKPTAQLANTSDGRPDKRRERMFTAMEAHRRVA